MLALLLLLQAPVRPVWSPVPGLERRVEIRSEQALEDRGGHAAAFFWKVGVEGEDSLWRIQVLDRYLESGGARALRLRREFEVLERGPSGDASSALRMMRSPECTGPLEGRSIEFQRGAEGEEFAWAGTEGDPIWFEGLRGDMTFASLLPPLEVAVGEEYELDLEVLAELLAPGGDLWPVAGCPEPSPDVLVLPPVTSPLALADFRGEVQGCWTGTRVVKGVEVAEMRLEIDVRATTTSWSSYSHPRID